MNTRIEQMVVRYAMQEEGILRVAQDEDAEPEDLEGKKKKIVEKVKEKLKEKGESGAEPGADKEEPAEEKKEPAEEKKDESGEEGPASEEGPEPKGPEQQESEKEISDQVPPEKSDSKKKLEDKAEEVKDKVEDISEDPGNKGNVVDLLDRVVDMVTLLVEVSPPESKDEAGMEKEACDYIRVAHALIGAENVRLAESIGSATVADAVAESVMSERVFRWAKRGLQVRRKDKDTMDDTGGTSKGRQREPLLKPPRDDVKKRYRTKRKTPGEMDKDNDLDPDTDRDPDKRED